MNDLNLRPTGKHRNVPRSPAIPAANYHPHGDGVIYPTLVRMGQEWSMRHLLIDPQGNFGSIDGDHRPRCGTPKPGWRTPPPRC